MLLIAEQAVMAQPVLAALCDINLTASGWCVVTIVNTRLCYNSCVTHIVEIVYIF